MKNSIVLSKIEHDSGYCFSVHKVTNQKPGKIKLKIPMQRHVVFENNDLYLYEFTTDGVLWTRLGNILIED